MRKFNEVKVAVVCTHKGLKGMKYTACNKWKKWNYKTQNKRKNQIKCNKQNEINGT